MGNTSDSNQEHVLMADMKKQDNKLEDYTWLCNSGATCHLTNDSTGVYDVIEINETAIIDDGHGLEITKKGKLDMKVGQIDGSTCDLTLDVEVMPEVAHLLLSLMMLMQEGCKMKTL